MHFTLLARLNLIRLLHYLFHLQALVNRNRTGPCHFLWQVSVGQPVRLVYHPHLVIEVKHVLVCLKHFHGSSPIVIVATGAPGFLFPRYLSAMT